jgi:hypothetical protein
MNFVKYLERVAPEGESVLLVKQIAKDNGQFAWPAYLPAKYDGKGAWYGNTASFITSRFKDGKPSASAGNCEYVAFLVLDDIGTKSLRPPIEPTWIMETSPQNYQWGYTFALDDMPTKGEFSAAIKAIADAGYTDSGAINPVRNFRLPASVNLKPDRASFKSILVEFHPEREFTLAQICAALDVHPADADTATVRPMAIIDTGNDEVLEWLSSRGDILESANAEGWVGVVCPNHVEHTDGQLMGRYHPLNRAYCCFHGHCASWDSRVYLAWVAEMGGPKHSHGLREEILAEVMHTAIGKLEPTDMFSTDAAAIIAEVEQKEIARLEKAEWYQRFAYVMSDDSYFDLQNRREFSRQTFNAVFRHVSCKSIHSDRKIEAAMSFDENRQVMGARVLAGITFAAGDSVIATRDGELYGNRWRDARPDSSRGGNLNGNISLWLDHCKSLVPDERELNHIWDYMAFKVQNPRVKINHAILHAGGQGIGKDTMYAPFIYAVCGPHLRNYSLMSTDTIQSAWGYHLEAEIIVINELKEADSAARRMLANKLKPVIAAPPEMLSVNRKGLAPYNLVNRLAVLAFSNDRVPLSLESGDRRWFATWSTAERLTPQSATAIWKWFNDGGGYDLIANWLFLRDVSAFNPAAPAPMTDFKMSLVQNGMSAVESSLLDMITLRMGEFASGVIASPFQAICERAAMSFGSKQFPPAALFHALEEAGWADMGMCNSRSSKTKKHIFCAPEFAYMSKSALRDMAEQKPVAKVVAIK